MKTIKYRYDSYIIIELNSDEGIFGRHKFKAYDRDTCITGYGATEFEAVRSLVFAIHNLASEIEAIYEESYEDTGDSS